LHEFPPVLQSIEKVSINAINRGKKNKEGRDNLIQKPINKKSKTGDPAEKKKLKDFENSKFLNIHKRKKSLEYINNERTE